MAIVAKISRRAFIDYNLRAAARAIVFVNLVAEVLVSLPCALLCLCRMRIGKLLLAEIRTAELASETLCIGVEQKSGIAIRAFISKS